MDQEMETRIAAALQCFNQVLICLIETHPNHPALAARLREAAERTEALSLSSTITDDVIVATKARILSYADFATFANRQCIPNQQPAG